MKFGGGVLKTADAVRHFAQIVRTLETPVVIVISAFNSITNRLEEVVKDYVSQNADAAAQKLIALAEHHRTIASELDGNNAFQTYIEEAFRVLQTPYNGDFDRVYDAVVSAGELMSAAIVSSFLNSAGVLNEFVDIRNCIRTDSVFREANILWNDTQASVKKLFSQTKIYITQGFIGRDAAGNTTTLGREGSDFTASVLAYCLAAESVHFWKEVRGIYSADPTKMSDFEFLPILSYREAVEQVYYGAKILHPKTIKPLQNKHIPVHVRPFGEPDFTGTLITELPADSPDHYPNTPIYIVKENQILISVSPKDFSFIAEDNLGRIFSLLAQYRIKVNLMENSAISFSVCVDNNKHKVQPFVEYLKRDFDVLHNSDLELVTIRHYDDAAIARMTARKQILLRQTSRKTIRFVLK